MLAVEKSPTEQPARVNGTHGAGVTGGFGVWTAGTVAEYAMVGAVSCPAVGVEAVSTTGDVQYAKDVAGSVLPSGLYVR
jgi:hypothetical protein